MVLSDSVNHADAARKGQFDQAEAAARLAMNLVAKERHDIKRDQQ